MESELESRNQLLREGFLKLPAQEAPPGVIPNFTHPSTTIYNAYTVIVILGVTLATTSVAIKMCNQLWLMRKVHLEDYCLMISWAICCFGSAPLSFLMRSLPMGIHQWETHMGPVIEHMFYWYCAVIVYNFLLMFLKTAIMLQMLRVFVPGPIRNRTFWAIQATLWVNIVFTVIYLFIFTFGCTPRAKMWDPFIKEGRCLDYLSLNLAASSTCLFTDVLILLLPQRVIYSLRLPWKRKQGLTLIFAIGILACVASAVRTYFNYVLWKQRSDYTYILARSGFCGVLQVVAGFLCAGLPALPRFVLALRNTLAGSRFEVNLKHLLRIRSYNISQAREEIVTIGGGNKQKTRPPKTGTDIEFEELVFAREDSTRPQSAGSQFEAQGFDNSEGILMIGRAV